MVVKWSANFSRPPENSKGTLILFALNSVPLPIPLGSIFVYLGIISNTDIGLYLMHVNPICLGYVL